MIPRKNASKTAESKLKVTGEGLKQLSNPVSLAKVKQNLLNIDSGQQSAGDTHTNLETPSSGLMIFERLAERLNLQSVNSRESKNATEEKQKEKENKIEEEELSVKGKELSVQDLEPSVDMS